MKREKIHINGIVQGVGFRPFVYKTAQQHNLTGFVSNSADGVVIEIEGEDTQVASFHEKMHTDIPEIAKILHYSVIEISINHDPTFVIRESTHQNIPTTFISPDIATCDDCLEEMFDKNNRRYLYPFINCTNCGPRYTIVEGIPYDRPLTSMEHFQLCLACQNEYESPSDRRFHAQPNACPECGPSLDLHNGSSDISSPHPIDDTLTLLQEGKIVAIKGIGGFHLAVDPRNRNAIKALRKRKNREEKPLALMVRDIETAKKFCHVSGQEAELLRSKIRPIVLLKKKAGCSLPEEIAPDNQYYGIMLPYSPLHHILLHKKFDCLVMTSANLSDEPIAIDNKEAIKRLGRIADIFLLHDRDILKRCDDSIMRVASDDIQIIRRSRGLVPSPVLLHNSIRQNILAVGGEQKNTIALSRDKAVFVSQYIGDLDNVEAFSFFTQTISHLSKLMEIEPEYIAHDLHHEYLSTKWAKKQPLPLIPVQHHHAHMVSVMAENSYHEKSIGIILDGTGYGTDGTIWGGEVLIGDAHSFERYNWLKPIAMPGGASAIKEPWRMGLSYLYEIYGNEMPYDIPFLKSLDNETVKILTQMIDNKINCPLTSSCGRLFDAVSAILGIRDVSTFDAQAAIELEMKAAAANNVLVASIKLEEGAVDINSLISNIVKMLQKQRPVSEIALYFHYQLAEYFIASAISARISHNISTIAMSGGVYQNKLFFEYLYRRLRDEGFTLLTHNNLPANDGGLSLGQIIIADAVLSQQKTRE